MEVLQSCPLFSGLTDAQIRALLEDFGGVRRKIKKGEEVPSHRLGLLLSGQLFIRGRSIDNRVYALNRIYPGAAFGAASLFLEDIELSSIFAEKSSEVILFAPEQAWAMLQSSPRFCQNYIRFLCGRWPTSLAFPGPRFTGPWMRWPLRGSWSGGAIPFRFWVRRRIKPRQQTENRRALRALYQF